MTEETEAPQGLPEGEPVAQPENELAPETGKEQPATLEKPAEPVRVEETADQKLEKAIARANALEKRIHRQNAKIADQARAAEQARRAAPQDEPPQGEQDPSNRQAPKQDDVEAHAQRLLEQREAQRLEQQWLASGRKEFPDFDQRCNVVGGFIDNDAQRAAFMGAILGEDDGHQVVAYLSDNPDEAERIFNLSPQRMALAIGRLSAKGFAPKPPPQSAAPPPIKPLVGSGRAETDPSKMNTEEWMKWREKQPF